MSNEDAKELIEDYFVNTTLKDEFGCPCDETEYIKAFRTAGKSLDAWHSVREEIIKESSSVVRDKYSQLQNEYCNGLLFAYARALSIIDKHLEEVNND